MEGEEIKLVFIKDKAFLTKDTPLDFKQLDCTFLHNKVFDSPAYWDVVVYKYFPAEKRLSLKIKSYCTGDTSFSNRQLALDTELSRIQRISFMDINTAGLLTCQKNNGLTNSFTPPNNSQINSQTQWGAWESLPVVNERTIAISETAKQETAPLENSYKHPIKLRESFTVPVEDLRFENAKVSFDVKFASLFGSIELSIHNRVLREEFNVVKNYIAKTLQSKRIHVDAEIEYTPNNINLICVSSPEIARIDEDFFKSLRINLVSYVLKSRPEHESAHKVRSIDKLFEEFIDKKIQTNTMYEDENLLFKDLVTQSKSKHALQLEYLSEKHLHKTMRLRFMQTPFSFIFLIGGKTHNYFVWETLNTKEATYIWQIGKDKKLMKQKLEEVESIINVLIEKGKLDYINAKENGFYRVMHNYKDTQNGFNNWQSGIEKILNEQN